MAARNIEMFNEPRKAVIVARHTVRSCFTFARVPRNDARLPARRSFSRTPISGYSTVAARFLLATAKKLYLQRVHLFLPREMFNYLTIRRFPEISPEFRGFPMKYFVCFTSLKLTVFRIILIIQLYRSFVTI